MRRVAVVLLALVTGVGVATALAEPAAARAVGSIEFTAVTPQINVGKGPTFRYTTHSLGDAATISLQRYLGHGRVEDAVDPVKGADLTVKAPALGSRGEIRLPDVRRAPDVASPVRFGVRLRAVTMATLCPHTATDQQFPRVCKTKTTQVGSTSLTSSMSIGATHYPGFFAGANIARPSCRSASAALHVGNNSAYKGYLKITQGNGIPVLRGRERRGRGHIGTLNVTLGSGKVYLSGATDESDGNSVYIAGTFNCWTATGTY